jgi:hypothetical protein
MSSGQDQARAQGEHGETSRPVTRRNYVTRSVGRLKMISRPTRARSGYRVVRFGAHAELAEGQPKHVNHQVTPGCHHHPEPDICPSPGGSHMFRRGSHRSAALRARAPGRFERNRRGGSWLPPFAALRARAPGGSRTHTVAGLSDLPLPVGIRGLIHSARTSAGMARSRR